MESSMNQLGGKDFFTAYLDYTDLDNSEAPAIYHRWVCASIIGALKGRSVYFPFGHSMIYPNQYIMLMGPPASKKGTAMGVGKSLLKKVGYTRFAADRTSKEAFLKGMRQFETDSPAAVNELEALVFDAPSESYICAGEFVDFIGQGDTGFMMSLTNMWDNLPEYRHPKITGRDILVDKPTINLLGGSTPTTFSLAFPPEAIGTGFLSRVILVHTEESGNKVAWPEEPDPLFTELLVKHLAEIKELKGALVLGKGVKVLGAEIYKKAVLVEDPRFAHYNSRRHIHLIKLASIMAVADLSLEITEKHYIRANTMLAMAEARMPKALGEFGASKYSGIASKILEFLRKKTIPQNTSDLWKAFPNELNKPSDLAEVLVNLKGAEKIQIITIKGKTGYLIHEKPVITWAPEFLDTGWLTSQERLL